MLLFCSPAACAFVAACSSSALAKATAPVWQRSRLSCVFPQKDCRYEKYWTFFLCIVNIGRRLQIQYVLRDLSKHTASLPSPPLPRHKYMEPSVTSRSNTHKDTAPKHTASKQVSLLSLASPCDAGSCVLELLARHRGARCATDTRAGMLTA